jgi:hypothetical protein
MAQDETLKRQSIIRNAINYSQMLIVAIEGLNSLQSERSKLVQDFQAADFTPSDLTHLTASQVGTLFDFVLATFQTNLADAGNGGRNIQILEQMRNS